MEQTDGLSQIYLCLPGGFGNGQNDLSGDMLERVSCLLLHAGDDGSVDRASAELIVRAVHDLDLPLVLEGDVAAAAALGADGVHVEADEDAYETARKTLGDDAIIGVACGLSRHTALAFAELGADYVAFSGDDAEALSEIVEWWSDVTIVPCVAWELPDVDTAVRMGELGADFVAPTASLWQRSVSMAATIEELAKRLGLVQAAA